MNVNKVSEIFLTFFKGSQWGAFGEQGAGRLSGPHEANWTLRGCWNVFLSEAELKKDYPDRPERFMEESSQYIAATGKDDRNDEHPEDTPGLCDGNPHGKHRPYHFLVISKRMPQPSLPSK